jgi:light-regulated signal transduction histidine kinase (bacteriophytochrome)
MEGHHIPLSDEAARTVFYVKDNGIGIPQEHWSSVFRVFRRLHPRNAYGGGSGAGLTIAKKIVERHRGAIWLDSTVGEGSTFYFTLGADEREAKTYGAPN